MFRRAAWLLALAFSMFPSVAPAAGAVDWQAFDWDDVLAPGRSFHDGMLAPGRLLVRFAPGSVPTVVQPKAPGEAVVTGQLDLDRVARELGITVLQRLFPALPARAKAAADPERERHFVAIYDASRASLRTAAQALASVAGVDLVEPDPMHRMHAVVPNDPNFSGQWWLRNTALGGADIRAMAAWYHSTGSSSIIVCVADSGVDWQHPDLGGTGPDYIDGVIWINDAEWNGTPGVDDDSNGKVDDFRGWDFVSNIGPTVQTPPQDVTTPDNDPMDYGGHGTWVSGCISALVDNGIGIASTNWGTKIMPCRIGATILDGNGDPADVVFMSFAAQSLDYARFNGADVYNASWGSSNTTSLRLATDRAIQAGMIVVTSAGNSGGTADEETASYLAGRADVISVAATNQSDVKATFSSFGTWVDISAPGVSILTTGFNVALSGSAQHVYGSPQGTSFSSPIVCGGFALAKAAYPGDTRQQLIDRVLAAVDPIDSLNPTYAGKLGSGRLNVAKLFDNPFWKVPDQLATMVDAFNTADPGDTVAVSNASPLNVRVVLPAKDLEILGGWDPTFTTRDPVNAKSVLQVTSGSGAVLQATNAVGPNVIFDGFELRGGVAAQVSFEPVQGYYGGGILLRDASPTLRNILVADNVAGQSNQFGAGGGVAVLGGSPLFEDVEITGNTSLRGAGLYVHRATPTFRRVSIHDNTSYTTTVNGFPQGGGVYVLGAPASAKAVAAGVLTFEGGSVSGHTVIGTGGGMHIEDSDVVIDGMTIEQNESAGDGAGIYVTGGSIDLRNSTLQNNVITAGNFTSGGGLFTTGAAATLVNNDFLSNSVGFNGGGFSLNAAGLVTVSGNLVAKNTAGIFAAGVYLDGLTAGSVFSSNTVTENTGASSGGNGVYLISGTLAVDHNIIAFNGTGAGTLADGFNNASGTVTFDCNDVYGNATGDYSGVTDPTGTNGNISADPAFCDPVTGDYTLPTSSPAANASCGLMGSEAASCAATDVDTPVEARRVALQQNVPNPFNPRTEIVFAVPKATRVSLRVFDLRGRVVRTLVDGPVEAGQHVVSWNGTDTQGHGVASGTYFYELLADGQRQVRKMGLIK